MSTPAVVEVGSFLTIARSILKSEISVIPVKQNKTPAVNSWKKYQSQLPKDDELVQMFSQPEAHGIAMICGQVSNNLECIDIDLKYDLTGELYSDLKGLISRELFEKLRIVKTRSGGYHWVYRCEYIEGNQKLANRYTSDEEKALNSKDKIRTLIETRGEGGYILAPTSPGYKKVSEGKIQVISLDEREELFSACRHFNQVYEEVRFNQPASTGLATYEITPWEDFNSRGDIDGLLLQHGFKNLGRHAGRTIYRRPGKDEGTSGNFHHELNLLMMFSSSTPFEAGKGYKPAAVFAVLEADGDFAKAARMLSDKGYGRRIQTSPVLEQRIEKANNTEPVLPETVFRKYQHLRITDETLIEAPQPVISICDEIIATKQNLILISGLTKGGKSAASSVMMAGAIASGEYDGFPDMNIAVNDKRMAVLHFDSEQARHKHQSNLKSVKRRCKLEQLPDFFFSYNIRQLEIAEYETVTKEIFQAAFEKCGGIHLAVIDGIADYIVDPNDQSLSNAIVKFFEKLAVDFNCPIILIIHLNPGSDKERGHLGSQLQRKCESVLTVRKEGDISYLEPKFLRNAGKGDIPLIQFAYDKDKGYHVYAGDKQKTETMDDKSEKRVAEVKELASDVFILKSFEYSEAIEAIMRKTSKGDRVSRDTFKIMKAHGFIVQADDKRWRLKTEEIQES